MRPQRPPSNLDITSHQLREYFQKHKICPSTPPEYSHFFNTAKPDIALTYEWSTTFARIYEYLCVDNICAHNACSCIGMKTTLSVLEIFYLMTFTWLLSPLASLPEDLSEVTIWIDILFNDQNNQNMKEELDEAENR